MRNYTNRLQLYVLCMAILFTNESASMFHIDHPQKACIANACLDGLPVELKITLELKSQNTFQLSITAPEGAPAVHFTTPLELKLTIGSKSPVVLDPLTSDTTSLRFMSTASKEFQLDQTSLPTANSGIYNLHLESSAQNGEYLLEPLDMKVRVSCSLPDFTDCTSCILNCGTWMVTW